MYIFNRRSNQINCVANYYFYIIYVFSSVIPMMINIVLHCAELYGEIPSTFSACTSLKFIRLENNPGLTGAMRSASNDVLWHDGLFIYEFKGKPQQNFYITEHLHGKWPKVEALDP